MEIAEEPVWPADAFLRAGARLTRLAISDAGTQYS
jgi:hypothetical protein